MYYQSEFDNNKVRPSINKIDDEVSILDTDKVE